jgi:heme oxygenase
VTPVTQILRERTKMRHITMEQTPLARDLMSLQLTLPRYVQILSTWVGAWVALENCIESSPFAPQVTSLLPSKRAHLGLQDLQDWRAQGHEVTSAAGVCIEDAFSQILPTTKAGLLGVCYVARGASLGGQVIARHLTTILPVDAGRGIAFFAPDEAPTLTWSQWSHALGAQLDTTEKVEQAVGWADATFVALQKVFSGAMVYSSPAQAISV